ncbi:hypothetical protein H7I77_13220 [Mycolicibacterium novocastrense]|uniref:Uncharacterized protein n=1 Tax=Mycolicibacterium novocastrense TaxID=59813 RepID=A0AAW5SJA4_MYCNV|nr:hypothetical protein [Mycolicibacterium novocastrense]MCV7024299.1 hypothetical protein [Mycolicibacterium novocastrense]
MPASGLRLRARRHRATGARDHGGRACAARGDVRRYPIGHFDLSTPPRFDHTVDDQLAVSHRTLPDPTTTREAT